MIVIALTIAVMFSLIALVFSVSRPHFILYALAAVVSLVGIHIHWGATFYLSRIVIIFFLISLLLRLSLGRRIFFPPKILSSYILLFGLILLFQLISAMLSSQILDGLRQMFIYVSVMTIFIAVIMVATRIEIIIKAIKKL